MRQMNTSSSELSYSALMEDMSEMSMSRSSRRHSTGIMKTATLDESISSLGKSSRRNSMSRMPVSFDIVEIREHPIILDESRNGPALTIDWKATNTEVTTVQEFDCVRRNQKVRVLSKVERVAILTKAGYTKNHLCNHFASDVEGDTDTQEQYLPQFLKEQPQKTMYYKMKKAAKKIKKQMVVNGPASRLTMTRANTSFLMRG